MSERLKTLPRWLIFALDLLCVVVAVLIAKTIRHNFNFASALKNLDFVLAVVVAINASLFYIFKTFAGIVRYTTMRDTFRLVTITALASALYVVIGFVYYQKGVFFLSRATIFINFFISAFGLVGYRMLVRHCYRVFFVDQLMKHRKKAVIFDTSEHGLHLKRVITDHPQSHLQICAFLDDQLNKKGKKLEGLPIYALTDQTFESLRKDGVKLVILANKEVPLDKLNLLVDKALQYGLRVQQVPPIQQWLDGKLATEQLKDVNIEDLLERDVITIHNQQIIHELKGRKILVTGAAGSIGSELVRQLTRFKPSLIILCDKAETPLHEICLEMQERFPSVAIKGYIGDICDPVRMEHLFEIYSPEFLFHAAAYKHVPLMEDNPSVAVLNNVLGTRVLAELAIANGVEKFVMVSTDKAVNPTNVMGASKRIAEIFTQSLFRNLTRNTKHRATKFITTRFGNVLGSNGSVIPRFRQQIEKGGPITVTHPDITRYFMTIPEACQLVIEAGVMGQGGEIFVFDMGEPVRIVDLANKMIRLSGRQPGVDIQIVYSGLRPGEKLYEEVLNTAENTLPTYHQKITIAQVREYDFSDVTEKVDRLIECAKMHYTFETVALMKGLVPEFISNNSAFESLDMKVKD